MSLLNKHMPIKRLLYLRFRSLLVLIGLLCIASQSSSFAQSNESIPYAPQRQKVITEQNNSSPSFQSGRMQAGGASPAPTIPLQSNTQSASLNVGTQTSLVEGQIERSTAPVNILFFLIAHLA